MASVQRRRVTRVRDGQAQQGPDAIAVEEPLEIEVDGSVVSTTMRTPGHDIELSLGWLVSEGVLSRIGEVTEARECFEVADETDDSDEQVRRIVKVTTVDGRGAAARLHATSSACGICGTDVIDLTTRTRPWPSSPPAAPISADVIAALPDAMRHGQKGFDASGGLHAAALFASDGTLMCVREDVGRHNAVDKVTGWALQEGRLPLRDHVLVVSGRASAELAHKAVVSGVPVLAAVSAPTTLAVDLARAAGLTLVAFVRGDGFNIYAGEGVAL